MIRKIYSLLFIILLGSNISKAQEAGSSAGIAFDNFFTIGWDVNIAMGNKFVDDVSFAGGKLEYRKMLANVDNVSLGFDFSWNSFHEYKEYQTYSYNATTDITTDLYKYNYTLPMAITVHKYFPSGTGIFIPYGGVGLGATYGRPSIIFNIYELYEDNWGFLIRPEIGTIIKFDPTSGTGLLLGVRYSFSTNQEEAFKIDNLESLGFNLGICWSY